jgi:hypothetical protein
MTFAVALTLKHTISKKSQDWVAAPGCPGLCAQACPFPYYLLGNYLAGIMPCYLFSHCMGCFIRIMALIDKVTNLLTIHHEVNSICGEDQEAVISVM